MWTHESKVDAWNHGGLSPLRLREPGAQESYVRDTPLIVHRVMRVSSQKKFLLGGLNGSLIIGIRIAGLFPYRDSVPTSTHDGLTIVR